MNFLALLLLTSILGGCGSTDSTREDILACKSRDGSLRAVIYRLFGGGAAGWQSFYVTVRHSTGPHVVVLGMNHGYDVTLEWRDNSALHIGYPSSATVFESKPTYGDGAVQIEPLPSTGGSLKGGSKCINGQPSALEYVLPPKGVASPE